MTKRILAVVIAIVMLFGTVAFAEESTLLSLSVYNPVITIDGQSMDFTGAALTLAGYVTDSALTAVLLKLESGASFENSVACAQLQLDDNGLTLAANGISDYYTFDISQYVDPATVTSMVAAMQLNTAIDNITAASASAESLDIAAVTAALGTFVTESDDNSVSFAITKEQSAALIASSNNAQVSQTVSAVEGNGSYTIDGTSTSISFDGCIYDADDDAKDLSLTVSSDSEAHTNYISFATNEFAFSVYYDSTYQTSDTGVMRDGTISVQITADDDSEITVNTGLMLMMDKRDTAEWAMIGTENTIDIASMTSQQQTTALMELISLASGAVAQLSTDCPMLGTLLSGALSSMMG